MKKRIKDFIGYVVLATGVAFALMFAFGLVVNPAEILSGVFLVIMTLAELSIALGLIILYTGNEDR